MICLKKYKVAVLLAAYNGSDWIKEQIDSILVQQNVDVTLFISIDKSSDNTLQICYEYLSTGRIVILDHSEHFGTAGKNFFYLLKNVDFTNFDFVCFADQDDIWFTSKISYSISRILQEQAVAFSSNVIAFWSDGSQKLVKKSYPQREFDFLFEAAGPGCTYVLNKSFAVQVQNTVRDNYTDIQDIYLHDWFLYAFARIHGYKWIIDDLPTMLYRQHDKNEVGVNFSLSARFNRYRMFVSSLGFKQTLLTARILSYENIFIYYLRDILRFRSILGLVLNVTKFRRNTVDRFYLMFLFILIFLRLAVLPN